MRVAGTTIAAILVVSSCGSGTIRPDGAIDAGSAGTAGTVGTTGAAGTSGNAGTTGAAGNAGSAGATGAGGTAALPPCTSTGLASPSMTAETFCAIFLDGCSAVTDFTIPADYMNMAMCVTSYMSLPEEQKMCRSYHVCSVATEGAYPHCLHAVGIGTCY